MIWYVPATDAVVASSQNASTQNGEEDTDIHEGRDGLPLKVAVVEVTVAPPVIDVHGDTGAKKERAKVELVPTITLHVYDIEFY